jgi:hypothetical protein
MALRPTNANKFAVTLLGSKLLPSEERGDEHNLSGLMSAISTGPMSQWKEILDVLFAPSQRAPFRFEDGLRDFEGRVGTFAIVCLSQFVRVALALGAEYFEASAVGPVTLDGAAIDVMMNDGSLHGLRQSVWSHLERFAADSGIDSLTTFSHMVMCSQSTHGEPEISESDMLAFNVVARQGDFEGLWKCVKFVKELLVAIFKDDRVRPECRRRLTIGSLQARNGAIRSAEWSPVHVLVFQRTSGRNMSMASRRLSAAQSKHKARIRLNNSYLWLRTG